MAIMESKSETIITDSEGRVVATESRSDTQNIKRNEEGEYIKVYSDGIKRLLTLSDKALKLLILLTKESDYADVTDTRAGGGMTFKLDREVKEELQDILGIKERYMRKLIKELEDGTCIKKLKYNRYQLNPFIFGKGYYEYRPAYKQGGIKNIRDSWNNPQESEEKSRQIEDNLEVIAMVKDDEDFANMPLPSESEYAVKSAYLDNIDLQEDLTLDKRVSSLYNVLRSQNLPPEHEFMEDYPEEFMDEFQNRQ